MKSRKDIKANVLWYWDHPRCRFRPGDVVIPTATLVKSQPQRDHIGQVGRIIAVSSGAPGRIRGTWRRMYTRYFVEFEDGQVFGYHSHFLKPTKQGINKGMTEPKTAVERELFQAHKRIKDYELKIAKARRLLDEIDNRLFRLHRLLD